MGFDRQAPSDTLDISSLAKLQCLLICRVQIGRFPLLPPNLEILKCVDCYARRNRFPAAYIPTGPVGDLSTLHHNLFSKIRVVEMKGIGSSIKPSLKLLSESSSLTHFTLQDSALTLRDFTYDLLEKGAMQHVTRLCLSFYELDDDYAGKLVSYCPALESLELSGAKITGVFIKRLANSAESRVKSIVLVNCTNVSSDALDWARERGIEVRSRLSSW